MPPDFISPVLAVTSLPIVWITGLMIGAGVFIRVILPAPPRYFEPESFTGHVSYVIDGDTLIMGAKRLKVRLWGVDAPEKTQAGYETATNTLKNIALEQKITCRKIATDRYGRIVARCFLKDGREINRLMIESKTTKEYKRYSKGFYSR